MAQIKLNFARLSIAEKIARVRQIVLSMTNNAHFPNPQPPLAVLTAAADALEQAESDTQAARQEVKTKTTIRNTKEDDLTRLVSQQVGHVTAVSGGDEAVIQSAGMDVRATPAASSIADHPNALGATAGDHDGSMDLAWDSVADAASYVIETSPDPPTATSWKHLGVSTKSSYTVTGLPSGSRVWFRVAAVNAAGQSGWSDPVSKIVP
jgi:predicted phage tail protein